MMIYVLAAAMTPALLIAVALGLRDQAQRVKLPLRHRERGGFDPR
jgi:hypothetical protein